MAFGRVQLGILAGQLGFCPNEFIQRRARRSHTGLECALFAHACENCAGEGEVAAAFQCFPNLVRVGKGELAASKKSTGNLDHGVDLDSRHRWR